MMASHSGSNVSCTGGEEEEEEEEEGVGKSIICEKQGVKISKGGEHGKG